MGELGKLWNSLNLGDVPQSPVPSKSNSPWSGLFFHGFCYLKCHYTGFFKLEGHRFTARAFANSPWISLDLAGENLRGSGFLLEFPGSGSQTAATGSATVNPKNPIPAASPFFLRGPSKCVEGGKNRVPYRGVQGPLAYRGMLR